MMRLSFLIVDICWWLAVSSSLTFTGSRPLPVFVTAGNPSVLKAKEWILAFTYSLRVIDDEIFLRWIKMSDRKD